MEWIRLPYRSTPCLLAAALLLSALLLPHTCAAQQETGKIIGHLRIERGTEPDHRILVTLKTRGLTLQTAYADSSGAFGFYNLPNNAYHVLIDDPAFQPVEETTIIDVPHETTAIINIVLVARDKDTRKDVGGLTGGNPGMVGLKQLDSAFPPAATKQFEKGLELEQKKKPDGAIAAYRKAIEIAPGFYPARNNLGSALMARGDLAGAEEQFSKVIELSQNDAAPYFNLGNVQLATGRTPLALETISAGLRKEPQSGLGHFLLGSVYQKQGKARDAEIEIKRSLELNPSLSRAHLALVNLYMQAQRNDLATEELRHFLKLAPDDPLAPKAREVLARLEKTK